jgi:hypothetical protein
MPPKNSRARLFHIFPPLMGIGILEGCLLLGRELSLERRRKEFVGRASVPIYGDFSPLYKSEIFYRYFAGFLLKCRKAK